MVSQYTFHLYQPSTGIHQEFAASENNFVPLLELNRLTVSKIGLPRGWHQLYSGDVIDWWIC